MIPRIIHFCVPKNCDELQRSCIARARELHPHWEIRIWFNESDPPENFPFSDYIGKVNSGAQLADLVRVAAIFEYGGVYLDSDVHLHRALDPILGLPEAANHLIGCSEDGINLSNGFFASTRHHAALGKIIAYLQSIEPDWTLPPNVTTGPQLFSRLLRYRSDVFILPRQAFYPYNWNEERPTKLPEAIFGVHEWNGSWKTEKPPARPSRPSFRARCKKYIKKNARRLVATVLPELLGRATHSVANYFDGRNLTVQLRNGLFLSLDPNDASLSPSLALKGTFEPVEEAFVDQVVHGGDWVIDAGANIGLLSAIAAAKCGPFGRVFAIEANPNTAEHIERMSALNLFSDRVRVMPLALSDRAGMLQLVGSPRRRGELRALDDSSLSAFRLNAGTATERLSVRCETLDALFPIDVPIRLLKLDVEGHEAHVLRGGRRLFQSNAIQCVMLEYGTESYEEKFSDLQRELKALEEFGYFPGRLRLLDDRVQVAPWPEYASSVPFNGHVTLVMHSPGFVI